MKRAPVRRIYHIVSTSGLYGTERVVLTQLDALKDFGHAFAVWLHENGPFSRSFIDVLGARGVDVLVLKGRMRNIFKGIVRLMRADIQADVIHAHEHKSTVVGYLLALRLGIPLIATFHYLSNEDPALRIYQFLAVRACRTNRVKGVFCVSQPIFDACLKGGIPKEKLCLLPNAVPVASSAPLVPKARENTEETPRVLLYLGRLSREKGPDILLRAASRISALPFEIRFVGGGALSEEIKAMAGTLGLGHRVTVLDFVRDVGPHLGDADLLVMPSRHEGLPLALLEALARGVPVLASAVGQIPDVLKNGGGWTVPPEDEQALGEKLSELLRVPASVLDDAGLAGWRNVRAHYCLETYCRDFHNRYMRILGVGP